MLAGELYDCGDPELMELWLRAKNLMQQYNCLDYYQFKIYALASGFTRTVGIGKR